MKLCDTCIYRNNVEQLKPCIIYRDDCEYYEKERMKKMTNEQVKAEIMQIYGVLSPNKQQALDMAIKALEQEPKTGHWIEIAQYSDGKHKIECSECKSHIFDRGHANSFNVKNRYKYCPNCGCRMVEPQESEDKE